MSKARNVWIGEARFEGVSFQSFPETDTPYKMRGKMESPERGFAICMTREEALDVVTHLSSMLGIRGDDADAS